MRRSVAEDRPQPFADRARIDAAEHRAERLPALAGKPHHLHLLDRREVARAGVDDDAREQHAEPQALEVRRLPHHVLARELVAALREHLDEGLRHAVAIDAEPVVLVALRKIAIHEVEPLLVRRIVLPQRIARLLHVVGGEDALRILEAGRLDHRADRVRHAVDEVQRLPADLGRPLDGHDGEFRGRHVEEHVGARRLELRHLRIEVGVAGFVAGFGDDRDRAGERILETLHVVFAVFVVLIEDRDLAVRLVGQQILAEDAAFGLIVRLPSHGPRMVDRIVPFGGAGGDEELRHLACRSCISGSRNSTAFRDFETRTGRDRPRRACARPRRPFAGCSHRRRRRN